MGRRPRHDHPGATHHVMNRGVDRAAIFYDDADRVEFGRRLSEIHERFGTEVVAYCLMPNHYHLLVHTPDGHLGTAMHHLSLTYTRHTNDRVGRDGPIFRGRYHSIPVSTDAYLIAATRYIHRNPLALVGIDDPADYRWSSYRSYLGLRRSPEFLKTEMVTGSDRSRIAGRPIDLDTAKLLAELAQSAADTEPTGSGPTVTARSVLALIADTTDCPTLRASLIDELGYPSDAARRMATHRARRLAEHPVVRAVLDQLPLVSDTRGDAA